MESTKVTSCVNPHCNSFAVVREFIKHPHHCSHTGTCNAKSIRDHLDCIVGLAVSSTKKEVHIQLLREIAHAEGNACRQLLKATWQSFGPFAAMRIHSVTIKDLAQVVEDRMPGPAPTTCQTRCFLNRECNQLVPKPPVIPPSWVNPAPPDSFDDLEPFIRYDRQFNRLTTRDVHHGAEYESLPHT